MNGHKVSDIMLDTGCSRTMVHRKLVSREQLIEGEATAVRCAHGDTMLYPMARVEMEVDGCTIKTVAAVCNTLPMDVLLGTDVAELDTLLRNMKKCLQEGTLALVATTRSMQGSEGSGGGNTSFDKAAGFRCPSKRSGTKGKRCLGYGYQVG